MQHTPNIQNKQLPLPIGRKQRPTIADRQTDAQMKEDWKNYTQVSQPVGLKLLRDIRQNCPGKNAAIEIFMLFLCVMDYDGRASVTLDGISKETGIEYTNVSRAVSWLEKRGYIQLERTGKKITGMYIMENVARRGEVPRIPHRKSTGIRTAESRAANYTFDRAVLENALKDDPDLFVLSKAKNDATRRFN